MSKKENDAIQAAVAAKLAASRPQEEQIEQPEEQLPELPEGVTAIPEFSVNDTKAHLQEIAVLCGMALPSTMTKAEMVELLEKHIQENTVKDEDALEDGAEPHQDAPEETDEKTPAEENAPAQSATAPTAKPRRAIVAYNGYVNLRRAPSTEPEEIAGRCHRGEELLIVGEAEGDGHKWYVTLGGQYIMADADLLLLQ